MNHRYIIVLIAACLLLASCGERLKSDAESRIGLRAAVNDMQLETRATASPYRGSVPTDTNPLEADVWFSDTDGTYGDTPGENTLPCRSTVHFTSGDMTYPDDVVRYATDGSDAYCVGLYPQSAWSANAAATEVTCAIDGTRDLMFAPQVSGSWNNPIDSPLAFSHLLTWLKICICAHETDAITSWGAITEITVENPSDGLTVTLATGDVTPSGVSAPITAFAGSCGLLVTTQEVGSVFCAPATSYNVTVKSENKVVGTTVAVNLVNLDGSTPTADYVAGKVYVLTLHFHPLTLIDATCTLTDWVDEYQFIMGH